jgi:hypothetical protein
MGVAQCARIEAGAMRRRMIGPPRLAGIKRRGSPALDRVAVNTRGFLKDTPLKRANGEAVSSALFGGDVRYAVCHACHLSGPSIGRRGLDAEGLPEKAADGTLKGMPDRMVAFPAQRTHRQAKTAKPVLQVRAKAKPIRKPRDHPSW